MNFIAYPAKIIGRKFSSASILRREDIDDDARVLVTSSEQFYHEMNIKLARPLSGPTADRDASIAPGKAPAFLSR